jgi:hypothetical protein
VGVCIYIREEYLWSYLQYCAFLLSVLIRVLLLHWCVELLLIQEEGVGARVRNTGRVVEQTVCRESHRLVSKLRLPVEITLMNLVAVHLSSISCVVDELALGNLGEIARRGHLREGKHVFEILT